MLENTRCVGVLLSSACTQSCCAAGWPEVGLHRPPDACGRVLLMTGTYRCRRRRTVTEVTLCLCLVRDHERTFQSSPGGPGPYPFPPVPTSQRPGRRPPRTAAGPTVWNVLYLNTGNMEVQRWTSSLLYTSYTANITQTFHSNELGLIQDNLKMFYHGDVLVFREKETHFPKLHHIKEETQR